MRTLVNMVAALTALVGLAAVLWFGWAQASREIQIGAARRAVERIGQEVARRASMDETMRTATGWPVTIDPKWFEDGVPRNALLAGSTRAWIEIASEEEKSLSDPRERSARGADARLAEFWYNPANGVVRARVATELSDAEAIDAYNRINGTHLDAIVNNATIAPRGVANVDR